MSHTHQGKLQKLPQFRAELMTAIPDYEAALHYQRMSLEELKALAEEHNRENDHILATTGTLNRPYVDLVF